MLYRLSLKRTADQNLVVPGGEPARIFEELHQGCADPNPIGSGAPNPPPRDHHGYLDLWLGLHDRIPNGEDGRGVENQDAIPHPWGHFDSDGLQKKSFLGLGILELQRVE